MNEVILVVEISNTFRNDDISRLSNIYMHT